MADLELCGVSSISEPLIGREASKKYLGKLFPAPGFSHYGVMYLVPMSLMQITVELKKSCDQRGIFIMHYYSVDEGSLDFRFASDFCLKFEEGCLRLYIVNYSGRIVPYLTSKIYWIKFLPLLSSEVDGAMVGFPKEREGEIIEVFHQLRKFWKVSKSIPGDHYKISRFLVRSCRMAKPIPQRKRKSIVVRLFKFLLGG